MDTVENGIVVSRVGVQNDDSGSKLVDGVVEQLDMAITVGLLAAGEKLPSEGELANKLGVSTVTLRQALTVLRSRGLIVTRRGRGGGSYIQDSSAANSQRVEAQLRILSTEKLRDLGDVVGALMGAAARLAAMRALPNDVDRVEELARVFAVSTRPDARRRADSRFHIELGIAAQSSSLTTLIVQAQGQIAQLLWAPDSPIDDESIREHGLIVEAIRHRDPDAAQRHAISHSAREARILIDRRLKLVTT